jgi:ABC-type Fe3+ transport system substrate-binding protein
MSMHRAAVCLLAAILWLMGANAHAADWQAGAGAEWQDLLARGRSEGKVVIAGRGPMEAPMSAAFKRDTGIELEFLGGEGRAQQSRIDREMRTGQVTIDLLFGGQTMVTYANDGYLKPIKPQLILPGVTDAANWVDGRIKWVDKEQQYMLIGGHYVFGWPVYNSAFVKPGSLTTWKDLLKPEFKGKIASYDPTTGPGQAQSGHIIDLYGIDFFKQVYLGQQVKISRDSRQLMEWAARGVYPIVLGGLPVEVKRFRAAGITTLVVADLPDGPGVLLGGSSVIAEPKAAPHPNAAAVFLNWYASQPGQQIFSEVWETPSNRVDVKADSIPDFVKPKPGVTYNDQYTEDWYLNRYVGRYRDAIVDVIGGH